MSVSAGSGVGWVISDIGRGSGPYTGETKSGGPWGLLIEARRKFAAAAELNIVNSARSLVGLTERVDAVLRLSNRLCNSSTTRFY